MLNSISVWAVLATSILAPNTHLPTADNSSETSINRVEATRTDFEPLPVPVTVPKTASLDFKMEGVTSIAAPKPEPKKEVKVEAPKTTPATKALQSAPTNDTSGAAASQSPSVPAVSIAVTPGSAQEEAQRQLSARGWGADQFTCLVNLWEKESNWNYTAANPSSGAYGIPQSLPGNKMATAGADWQTNPATQIKWGLGYISERYQTPCGAWNHSVAVGWY